VGKRRTCVENRAGPMKNISVHDLYDHHTLLIMRTILRGDSCCIDVGAHVGAFLKEMIALCPNGRHYAFEPIPKLAAELKRRFPFVGVYDVALSDEDGRATFFHVENDPAYSGLRKRRYDISDPIIREIQVPTARLDNIIPPGQHIDFIKIDVEGAEFQVLRGAQRILEESSPSIIFEFGMGAADCYGTTAEALFDLLVGQHGLELNRSGQKALGH
jgi:FkbM family methyltransferase